MVRGSRHQRRANLQPSRRRAGARGGRHSIHKGARSGVENRPCLIQEDRERSRRSLLWVCRFCGRSYGYVTENANATSPPNPGEKLCTLILPLLGTPPFPPTIVCV